ncbi:MAG: hypothetical protein DCC64_15325 [Planctomycetota bacterium]|nr:MAG: hypothetical protein DCC64_15325 [Planctomycetota bacterium]
MVVCAALLLSACGQPEEKSSPAKEEVIAAIETWAQALEKGDYDRVWELMSRDSHELWARNWSAPGAARDQAKALRLALESEFTAAEEKERIRRDLEKFPPAAQLDGMTPQKYFAWKVNSMQTADQRKAAREFHQKVNVKDVVIEGDNATVVWIIEEAERFYLVREEGKWRIAPNPRDRREMEAMRKKEEEGKEKR